MLTGMALHGYKNSVPCMEVHTVGAQVHGVCLADLLPGCTMPTSTLKLACDSLGVGDALEPIRTLG